MHNLSWHKTKMSIIQEDLHEIVHVDISVVYAEEGRNEAFS